MRQGFIQDFLAGVGRGGGGREEEGSAPIVLCNHKKRAFAFKVLSSMLAQISFFVLFSFPSSQVCFMSSFPLINQLEFIWPQSVRA